MYQSFKQMMHDLFSEEDFVQTCYINGFKTKCIVSSIGNNLSFTEAGLQSEQNFTLDLQIATLDSIPQEGQKVIFRDKTYKISSTETDSANASIKLYLIALSRGA